MQYLKSQFVKREILSCLRKGPILNKVRLISFNRSVANNSSSKIGVKLALGITLVGVGLGGDLINLESKIFGKADDLSETYVQQAKDLEAMKQGALSFKGVLAWGSNEFGLVAPNQDIEVVKEPKEIEFFKGWLLRDLKFGTDVAALVNDKGDVYLWGKGYFENKPNEPELTLKGKDIVAVEISESFVLAKSKAGKLFCLDKRKSGQKLENTAQDNSGWFGNWLSGETNSICFKELKLPKPFQYESIKDFKVGLHHMIVLTNQNKVLSMSLDQFGNDQGQLGLGNYKINETFKFNSVDLPDNAKVDTIQCGFEHSLLKTTDGKVFAFGSNKHGQLSLETLNNQLQIPSPLDITANLAPLSLQETTQIKNVYSSGNTSFILLNKKKVKDGNEFVQAYSIGFGSNGQLGNGALALAKSKLGKIKQISDLIEYSTIEQKVQPISIKELISSSTHTFALLQPSTTQTIPTFPVYVWGCNNSYQCNIDKKGAINVPVLMKAINFGTIISIPHQLLGSFKSNGYILTPSLVAGENVSAYYTKIEQ